MKFLFMAMKTYSKFSLLTLSSLFALSASAQTIISSTTNNGSFEDGSGSAIDLWVPPINTGTVQEQRLNNNASDGSFSAVVGHGTQGGSKMNGVLLNTGHDVSAGETFDFSFDWIPLFNWTTTAR